MPKYNDFDLDIQTSNVSSNLFVFSNKKFPTTEFTMNTKCTDVTNKTCPPTDVTMFKC